MQCKTNFPILQNELVYLDNGSTTQKPQVVIDAISNFYTTMNANVHRGIYSLSENATLAYQNARETVATFINARPEEIIFTSGTTQSCNMVAWMLASQLQSGDEIVLTDMEHHANLLPWQQVAKKTGAVLKFIPLTQDYHLDISKAKEIITPKTKIISVSHISNVLGTINPVKELATLAHAVNATFIIDAAQSVGHIPVDVKDLNCDFLTFSAHKMCGPTGIGVLYGKKEHLEKVTPVVVGGGMVRNVTKEDATWADLPEKFEAGTPNIAGAIGFAAAINYLSSVGIETIQTHGNELTQYALKQLQGIGGLTIIGPSENRAPVFSFTLEGIHPHDVAQILNQYNIAVRAGHHCAMPLMKQLNLTATTRASFYLYNTKEDVDKLIVAIKKVQEVFR